MLRRLAALLCLSMFASFAGAMTPAEQSDAISYLNQLREIQDRKLAAQNALDLARTDRRLKAQYHERNTRAYYRHTLTAEEWRQSDIAHTRAVITEKLKENYLAELDADYSVVDLKRAVALGDFKKIKPLARAFVHRWEVKMACAQLELERSKANLAYAEWHHKMVAKLHDANHESFFHLLEDRAELEQAHRDVKTAQLRHEQLKNFIKESLDELERMEKAGALKPNPPPPGPAKENANS